MLDVKLFFVILILYWRQFIGLRRSQH